MHYVSVCMEICIKYNAYNLNNIQEDINYLGKLKKKYTLMEGIKVTFKNWNVVLLLLSNRHTNIDIFKIHIIK